MILIRLGASIPIPSALSNELKTKLTDFPVTIVYVESLEALGYIHQFLNYELKDQQFVGEAIPENRILAQYHKDYTQAMKQQLYHCIHHIS
jgi:hypothetical protein